MRLRSSALALVAVAALAACSDSPVAPADPGQEVVFAIASDETALGQARSFGRGEISFFFGTDVIDNYRFTAVKRANGTVGGIFEFRHRYLGLTVHAAGDIVCLGGTNKHVRFGGVVRETSFEEGIPLGSELTWSVTDVGTPDEENWDSASSFLGHDAESYCAEGLPYDEFPVKGDIRVRTR